MVVLGRALENLLMSRLKLGRSNRMRLSASWRGSGGRVVDVDGKKYP